MFLMWCVIKYFLSLFISYANRYRPVLIKSPFFFKVFPTPVNIPNPPGTDIPWTRNKSNKLFGQYHVMLKHPDKIVEKRIQ